MKKHFYSHLIETESVTLKLHELSLTESERAHIISLIDSSLHHVILDAILSELSEADKTLFLMHIAENNHDAIWRLLNSKIDGVEEKIQRAADSLKTELHKDISEVHKNV